MSSNLSSKYTSDGYEKLRKAIFSEKYFEAAQKDYQVIINTYRLTLSSLQPLKQETVYNALQILTE